MNKMKKILFLILCIFMITPICLAKETYKETSKLSDKDISDKYQRNYTTGDKTISNLYKSAEWTDKDKLEGKIIIKDTRYEKVKEETTAVYVFITCDVHGFTKENARKNILYLLEKYDHVDVISIDGNQTSSIVLHEDVQESDVNNILSSVTFSSAKHYSPSVYTALYQYLFGSTSSTVQLRNPTAIYVSLDLVVSYGTQTTVDTGTTNHDFIYYTYDCWNILKQYQKENRYFSMVGFDQVNQTSYMDIKDQLIAQGYNFLINDLPAGGLTNRVFSEEYRKTINTVIGLADPSAYPGINADHCILDNVTSIMVGNSYYMALYKGNFNGGNFDYVDLLEEGETHILKITDKVKDQFEITSYKCNYEGAKISVEDNVVTAVIDDYEYGKEVVIEIDVKYKEKYRKDITNKWMETNDGDVVSELILTVTNPIINKTSSPKLSILPIINPNTFSSLKYLTIFIIIPLLLLIFIMKGIIKKKVKLL